MGLIKGTFDTIEAAVDNLFPFASEAKRSKVRYLALVLKEPGDLWAFAEKLT